jgi:hypothetical protein
LTLKILQFLDVSRNAFTGNVSQLVGRLGDAPFAYNCFDPAVPPSSPSC